MEIQIKGVKQLREKIEKRTGDLITAAMWNQAAVMNKTLVGESGPELMTPARKAADVIVECEYCAQLNLLVPEQAHKGCGACGGMLNLDLVAEEDDETRRLNRSMIGAPSGGQPLQIIIKKRSSRETTLGEAARAMREFQVAIGSSLLPSVKAATDACNKLGRAIAGNQAAA